MDAPKLGFLPLLAKWVLWLELSIIELLLLHWYLSSLILVFLKKKDLGEWNLYLVDRMRKYKTVRATKQTKVKGWVIFFIKDKVQVSEHKNGERKTSHAVNNFIISYPPVLEITVKNIMWKNRRTSKK